MRWVKVAKHYQYGTKVLFTANDRGIYLYAPIGWKFARGGATMGALYTDQIADFEIYVKWKLVRR